MSFPLIATPLHSAEQLFCHLLMARNHKTHRALECIRGGLGNIVIGKSSHPGFNPFLALKYLAEGLNTSPHFQCLTLCSNFTSEHKYHLLVLIMTCISLQDLQFFSCNINLSGAIPVLAAAFKYRRILIMANCSLNDEDLYELGKVLYHCRNTLYFLDINDNTFSSKAYTEFLEAIRDSRCLLRTLYCDQYHTLNPTQQSIVDDIQYWRTTHQMPKLYVGRCNRSSKFISTLYQDNAMQSLPPDIVHGLSL